MYQITNQALAGAGLTVPSAASVHLYTGSGKEMDRNAPVAAMAFPRDTLREVPLYCSDETAFGFVSALFVSFIAHGMPPELL